MGNIGLQLMGSLLVLVVLAGVAYVVIKKYLPRLRLGSLVGQGRSVRLVESISIGPRQHVHLLKVGGRSLLISATREDVRLLADVTEAIVEGEEQAAPAPAEGDGDTGHAKAAVKNTAFSAILTKLGGGK